MVGWNGWPLERMLYLFLSAAFLLVWIQVTLYHWRGGFRSKFMYGPVLYTPLLILAGIAMAASRQPGVVTGCMVLYIIGALEGLAGVLLHLHGVKEMVGGFNIRNFMAGPPVALSTAYMALSALGALIYYWPRLVPQPMVAF
jgi:hypothetical protein